MASFNFNITIPADFQVGVDSGVSLKQREVIASRAREATPIIDLAKLLGVNPKLIEKFLCKQAGEAVVKNEVIAMKKSLFSSTQVKSPRDGMLQVLPDQPGYICIFNQSQDTIITPVAGKVAQIESDSITIKTNMPVIVGTAGEGSSKGEVYFIEDSRMIYSISRAVAGKIVAGVKLESTATAKIKVLEGKGIITEKVVDTHGLPYFVVDNPLALADYIGRKVEILNEEYQHYLIIGD